MNYSNLFDLARNFYTSFSYNNKYGKAIIPFRYFLELTYRCNLKCPYCYVGLDRNKEELSFEEWKHVINQIPFYGIVTIVGGEPLIRNDFIDIFAYTAKKVWYKTDSDEASVLCFKTWMNRYIESEDGFHYRSRFKYEERYIPVTDYISNPNIIRYINPESILKIEDYVPTK